MVCTAYGAEDHRVSRVSSKYGRQRPQIVSTLFESAVVRSLKCLQTRARTTTRFFSSCSRQHADARRRCRHIETQTQETQTQNTRQRRRHRLTQAYAPSAFYSRNRYPVTGTDNMEEDALASTRCVFGVCNRTRSKTSIRTDCVSRCNVASSSFRRLHRDGFCLCGEMVFVCADARFMFHAAGFTCASRFILTFAVKFKADAQLMFQMKHCHIKFVFQFQIGAHGRKCFNVYLFVPKVL